MHQLLTFKHKIALVVISTLAVSIVVEWMGIQSGIGFQIAAVEIVVLLLMSTTWGWRLWKVVPGIPRWMRVDLSGEWKGQLVSEWRLSETAPPLPPILVAVNVRQSWSDIVLAMQTDKMRSRSFGAFPTYDPVLEVLQVHYFYKTEPTARASADNPPQRLGCGVARIELEHPTRMSITYTNERGAGGEIQLERQRRR
jgi:hypothetical protein